MSRALGKPKGNFFQHLEITPPPQKKKHSCKQLTHHISHIRYTYGAGWYGLIYQFINCRMIASKSLKIDFYECEFQKKELALKVQNNLRTYSTWVARGCSVGPNSKPFKWLLHFKWLEWLHLDTNSNCPSYNGLENSMSFLQRSKDEGAHHWASTIELILFMMF